MLPQSVKGAAGDLFAALGPKARSPLGPAGRSGLESLGKKPRSVDNGFDEQLEARLNKKDRNNAPKESADPTLVGSPVVPTPHDESVPQGPPATAGGLDPTTAGTAPSEDLDDQPSDPTAALTSAVKAATPATAGTDPVETPPGAQGTDESVWKFVVDTPATGTTEEQSSGPESSDASGSKASPKPVARPALPDVHAGEKLVDEAIERPLPPVIDTSAVDPTTQAEQTGQEGPFSDPALAEASRGAGRAERAESNGSHSDAIVAARFQRAYEGTGTGDPTSQEQRQPSDDPTAASSLSSVDDNSMDATDVVSASASQPQIVNHDSRSAIITPLPPTASEAIDPLHDTSHSSPLGGVDTPEPDTADRLVQSFRMQFLRGGGDAVVHIRPEHLGPLTVSVRVEHGSVSAHVTADNPVVAEWLQANEQMLRDSLKASGLILERLVIQKDPEQSGHSAKRDPAQSPRNQRRRDLERQSTFEVTA